MKCPNCGNENGSTPFCTACGTRFSAVPPAPAPVPAPDPAYYSAAPRPSYEPATEVTPDMLPEQYRPLSAWAYFGLQLLFAVPVVGLVFLIVFSFSKGNINRRSFARSYWCFLLILAVIVLIAAIAGGSFLYMLY